MEPSKRTKQIDRDLRDVLKEAHAEVLRSKKMLAEIRRIERIAAKGKRQPAT